MIFRTVFCLFFLLQIIKPSFAQKKAIQPKKGEIVFLSEDIIKDEKLFIQSYNDMAKKMMSALKNVILEEQGDEIVDTTMLSSITDNLGSALPELIKNLSPKTEHHYVYRDSLIENYTSQHNINTGDLIILINPNRSTFILQSKLGGKDAIEEAKKFEYTKTRDSSITELRNEYKTINGFKCFKVLYKYKQLSEDMGENDVHSEEEFLAFMSDVNYYKEFWVTEEIQSIFHPVCKDKEILMKYYPLEIREYNDLIKGMEHTFTLKSISLSN